MQLDVTSTTNLQRATIKDANGAQMHNQHDPNVNHENVQIIKEDTELNRHIKLLNRDDVLQQQYGEMIKQRNEKTTQRFNDGKIGLDEYKQRLTDVNKYLNTDGKTPKQALTTYVWTLGDVDTEFQILDALGFKYQRQKVKGSEGKFHERPQLTDPKQRKEFADIMTETYTSLAKQINNTKDCGLKVVDVWVHMDEGGMPHAQGEMVNAGKTKTGKPSYNLNQALGMFNKRFGKDVYTSKSKNKSGKVIKSANGKVALSEFRRIIDKQLVTDFNRVLKRRKLDKKLQVNMIRLGRKGGLTMKEYQVKKQAENEAQKAQEVLKQTYEELTGNKALNAQNEPMSPLECAKGIKNAVKQTKQEKTDLDDQVKEAEQKKQEAIQQQQQAEASCRTVQANVEKLQSEEKKLRDKIQQRRRLRVQMAEKEMEVYGNQLGVAKSTYQITEDNVEAVEPKLDETRQKTIDYVRENRPLIGLAKDIKRSAEMANVQPRELVRDRQKLVRKLATYRNAFKHVYDLAMAGVSIITGKRSMEYTYDIDKQANSIGMNYDAGFGKEYKEPNSFAKLLDNYKNKAIKMFKDTFGVTPYIADNQPPKPQQTTSYTSTKPKEKDDGYGFGD